MRKMMSRQIIFYYHIHRASGRQFIRHRQCNIGANRAEMERGAEELGVPLWEHVGNVIEAMRRIAPELGL